MALVKRHLPRLDEQEVHFLAFAFSSKRAQARSRLKELLASYLDLAPEHLLLETAVSGKPFLNPEQAGGLVFNLSHSGDLLLIALGMRQELGVDVEKERE